MNAWQTLKRWKMKRSDKVNYILNVVKKKPPQQRTKVFGYVEGVRSFLRYDDFFIDEVNLSIVEVSTREQAKAEGFI